MIRTSAIAAGVLAAMFLGGSAGQFGGLRQETPLVLVGAGPEIDASRYGSLQAAIDAVPPEGGILRLPAGVFEINQPLIIAVGDLCVEGAGAATHIKNANASGEAAILLAHSQSQEGRRSADRELWRIRLANFRVTGSPESGHGI